MTPEISDTCMFLTIVKDIWDAVHRTYSKTLDAAQVKQDSHRVCQYVDHYRCFETKCLEDAAILKNYIENDRVYDFLVGLNAEFDQVRVQIFSKELSTLNETILII
ncbi:hypothetical protein AAG906_021573 [Vitis piasezkii]